jgi:hypothetical protein
LLVGVMLAACAGDGGAYGVYGDAAALPAPPPPAPPVYTDDIHANATAVAANATAQAAYTAAVRARERAREAAAQGTTVARATDHALVVRATEVALSATATMSAIQASAYSASLEATATAEESARQAARVTQALSVQATEMAFGATSTAVALLARQEQAAADWEDSVVTPARKVAVAVGIFLLLAASAFCGLRAFDALILRARIIRDPSGHAIIVPELDRQGRQLLLLPHRAPGAVLQIAPPATLPAQVAAEAVDAEVTRRAQLVEAIGITSAGNPQARLPAPRIIGDARAADQLGSLTQAPLLRLIPSHELPPPEIADQHAIQAMDEDWRRSDE